MQSLVVTLARGRSWGCLAGALALFGAGTVLLLDHTAVGSDLGWAIVTLSGACAIICAAAVVDRRPRIIIDDDGVFDRSLGAGTIPWERIRAVHLKRLLGLRVVELELATPMRWRKPWRHGGTNRVYLNLLNTAADAEQVHACIREWVSAFGVRQQVAE